jgi:hypothetical protein
MFKLIPHLYFVCPESGKEIPIRPLDEKDPADARLIRKLQAREEDHPARFNFEFARQF